MGTPTDPGTFDDYPDDGDGPDDTEALAAYADELTAAVAAYGVEVPE